MLLTTADLAQKFPERLAAATSVHIAVAWITSTAYAHQLAAVSANKRVAVLVGVSGNMTSAEALTILLKSGCELAIAPTNRKFHPKVFIFSMVQGDLCWVGSANLTDSGFNRNVELVHEFESSDIRNWFDSQWASGKIIDQAWIDEYSRGCVPVPPTDLGGAIPPFPKQPGPFKGWDAYYKAVLRSHMVLANESPDFAVFSGANSYLKVIRDAEQIMEKEWDSLSDLEIAILWGLDYGGANYGALGCMKAAFKAKGEFEKSTNTRWEIKAALDEVRVAKVGLVDVPLFAQKAFEKIQRPNLDVAVATRLLALARPDVFLSVNSSSRERLAQKSGLPASQIDKPAGYKHLIEWVLQSKWWNASRPSGNGWDSQLWPYRTALIDVLVREDIDHSY